eukprot:gb/GECG01016155.1/.p1 GENE.gb/GECG01016155.1/~~gb/GECG01016155.1/.p1  ORF type:complete len:1448 (+),score=158.56 gb/GECG01016155.1/:1-4344(+)
MADREFLKYVPLLYTVLPADVFLVSSKHLQGLTVGERVMKDMLKVASTSKSEWLSLCDTVCTLAMKILRSRKENNTFAADMHALFREAVDFMVEGIASSSSSSISNPDEVVPTIRWASLVPGHDASAGESFTRMITKLNHLQAAREPTDGIADCGFSVRETVDYAFTKVKERVIAYANKASVEPGRLMECGLLCLYCDQCFSAIYPETVRTFFASYVDQTNAVQAKHFVIPLLWSLDSRTSPALCFAGEIDRRVRASSLDCCADELEKVVVVLASMLLEVHRNGGSLSEGLPLPLPLLYSHGCTVESPGKAINNVQNRVELLPHLNAVRISLTGLREHVTASDGITTNRCKVYGEIGSLWRHLTLVLLRATAIDDGNPLTESQRMAALTTLRALPVAEAALEVSQTIHDLYIRACKQCIQTATIQNISCLNWLALWYVRVPLFMVQCEESSLDVSLSTIRQAMVVNWLTIIHIRLHYYDWKDEKMYPAVTDDPNVVTSTDAVYTVSQTLRVKGLDSPLAFADSQELIFQSMRSRLTGLEANDQDSVDTLSGFVAHHKDNLLRVTGAACPDAKEVHFYLDRLRSVLQGYCVLEANGLIHGKAWKEIQLILRQNKMVLFLILMTVEETSRADLFADLLMPREEAVTDTAYMLSCYLSISSVCNNGVPSWWAYLFGSSSPLFTEGSDDSRFLAIYNACSCLGAPCCSLSAFDSLCCILEGRLERLHLSWQEAMQAFSNTREEEEARPATFDAVLCGMIVPWLLSGESMSGVATLEEEDSNFGLCRSHFLVLKNLEHLVPPVAISSPGAEELTQGSWSQNLHAYLRSLLMEWEGARDAVVQYAHYPVLDVNDAYTRWYLSVLPEGTLDCSWLSTVLDTLSSEEDLTTGAAYALAGVPWERLADEKTGLDLFFKVCSWSIDRCNDQILLPFFMLISRLSIGLRRAVELVKGGSSDNEDEALVEFMRAEDILAHFFDVCSKYQASLCSQSWGQLHGVCLQLYVLSTMYNLVGYVYSESRHELLRWTQEDTTQLAGKAEEMLDSILSSLDERSLSDHLGLPLYARLLGTALSQSLEVVEGPGAERDEMVRVSKPVQSIALRVFNRILAPGDSENGRASDICILHEILTRLIDSPTVSPTAIANWIDSLGEAFCSSDSDSVLFQLLTVCFEWRQKDVDDVHTVDDKLSGLVDIMQLWIGTISSPSVEHDDKQLSALTAVQYLPKSWAAIELFADIATLFPRELYRWTNKLRHSTRQQVEKLVKEDIAPRVLDNQLSEFEKRASQSNVRVEGTGIDESNQHSAASPFLSGAPAEFTVKCRREAREICATYAQEDAKLSLIISIPATFPLKQVEVSCDSKIGISDNKWRRWELQIRQMMSCSGLFWEALCKWRDSIKKEFEGVEPCPICYSVVHVSDHTLPKTKCHVCNSIFHATCVYKWFRSSGDSKCPMCRSDFF